MNKLTMSVHEMSEQMGISLPKAYELTKQEGFPVLRVGKRVIIPVSAFENWLMDEVSSRAETKARR